jgi:hypothetical protein
MIFCSSSRYPSTPHHTLHRPVCCGSKSEGFSCFIFRVFTPTARGITGMSPACTWTDTANGSDAGRSQQPSPIPSGGWLRSTRDRCSIFPLQQERGLERSLVLDSSSCWHDDDSWKRLSRFRRGSRRPAHGLRSNPAGRQAQTHPCPVWLTFRSVSAYAILWNRLESPTCRAARSPASGWYARTLHRR